MVESKTPSLLGLPRELRDEIYSYFMEYHRQAPLGPYHAGRRRRASNDIMYPERAGMTRASRLESVCRQIREELMQNVHELQERGGRLELDIMVKGYLYYPTWTRLPVAVARGVPLDLHVNLRIFSTESFRSNDGWPRQPGAGFRSLFTLLDQFLRNGVAFRESNVTGEHYCINNLHVCVIFIDHYTPATWPQASREIFGMLKALAFSGTPYPHVKVITAESKYRDGGRTVHFSREWPVAQSCLPATMKAWNSQGFSFQLP